MRNGETGVQCCGGPEGWGGAGGGGGCAVYAAMHQSQEDGALRADGGHGYVGVRQGPEVRLKSGTAARDT